MATALVTGATSGIGHGFATRLASDGFDMVLVARDQRRLDTTATELADTGVGVEVIAADLGKPDQLRQVEDRLTDGQRPIDMLVNNAGFGLNQRFVGGDIDAEQSLIDVMVTAVMRLTHAAVPGMVARGHGAVINVSSIASFLPFGTYSAAKSWTTFFTEGLATELEGTGVRVGMVRPGPASTEQGTSWSEETVLHVMPAWERWGHLRHSGALRPQEIAEAIVTMVSVPKGTHYTLIEVEPEAPVDPDRSHH